MKKGAQGYILLSSLEVEGEVELGEVLVIKDYSKVFPDDVPGLPPLRDIQFVIDLVPNSGPISFAPYRMSPTKLAELKLQLEDMLVPKVHGKIVRNLVLKVHGKTMRNRLIQGLIKMIHREPLNN